LIKVALQVIAFNVDPWINAMLRNANRHVDKIFIAYPPRPWAYSAYARNNLVNPTSLNSIELNGLECEVEVVRGDWKFDEDTRNCLLDKARSEGFDWMVIQDADEFYTNESWVRLLNLLKYESTKNTDLIITPWYNFWKSPEYVIKNIDGTITSPNEGFAVKCNGSDVKFIYSRTTNSKQSLFVDEPCYHYSYTISDEQMLTKISTWAHTGEMQNPGLWYKLKWKYWIPSSKNLHPGSPHVWQKAIKFPYAQPGFVSEIWTGGKLEARKDQISLNLLDWLWDMRSWLRMHARALKRSLRNVLFNHQSTH